MAKPKVSGGKGTPSNVLRTYSVHCCLQGELTVNGLLQMVEALSLESGYTYAGRSGNHTQNAHLFLLLLFHVIPGNTAQSKGG